MRRVALALFSTVAGLVMLLSFKSNSTASGKPVAITATSGSGETSSAAATTAPTVAGSSSGSVAKSSSSSSKSSSSSSKSTSVPTSAAAATSKTVTGNVINTRWGPVQVQITVKSGKLASVSVLQYPNGNGQDAQINSYALPQLNQEAIAAGSAKIDMVSGATYTSTGYIDSLQSALDKAGV